MNEINPLQQKDIDYLKIEVQDLKKSMNEGFNAVHLKLDVMSENFVRHPELQSFADLYDEKLDNLKEEINDIQEDKKWIIRVVGVIIITAIIGLVITVK